jgi:type VI secretion system protein ImpK
MHPIDDPFGTPPPGTGSTNNNGGGNGQRPADDRTMIMPRPGGRAPDPAPARGPSPSPQPAPMAAAPLPTQRDQGLNPLEQAAGPLLALLTRLRNTIAHPAPASLRAQMLGYLRQFEDQVRQAGVAQDEMMLARYVLCTALDEAVLSTPWGSSSEWGKQSLLITLHNEAWGGEKVFQLLDHCLQNPRDRLHLLELLYLCISLGFEGRYRVMNDGRSQLEALRERTAATIRSVRGERERELSPHWRGLTVVRDRLSQYLPPWVGIAIGLALLLLLVFGLRMMLAADAEPVFKKIHALGEIPVQAIDRPVMQPKIIERPRLAGFLAEDIKAQRVAVEDAVDRSVVTIRGDELFGSGSASIDTDLQPLLMRIADAVQKVKGNVLVTGHSDNRPIATLRFPSNWKLSQARAQEVAELLAAKTGDPARFKAEGRSDTEPVASNATNEGRARNRRVEITVFAEGVE